jgi:hypothetical protein
MEMPKVSRDSAPHRLDAGPVVDDRSRFKTVRVIDIADLLGVSHQRASKIVDEPGFPRSGRTRGTEPAMGSARGRCLGEDRRREKAWR